MFKSIALAAIVLASTAAAAHAQSATEIQCNASAVCSATINKMVADMVNEDRKARIPKHDPASINLCPAPMRMTDDGCQRGGR